MDDVVNRFARELADAIAAAVAESPQVEACREKARAAGFEMKVTLEAVVGFVSRSQTAALAKVPAAQISNGLDGNRQAWLEDPDGNRIELMEMAPDCLQYQAIRRLRAASAKPA